MSDLRQVTFGLSMREPDEGDGRTLEGMIVPYGEVTYLAPEPERFVAGSLSRSVAERGDRVKLFRSHDHTNAVGQALGFRDTPEGLTGTFRLYTHALDLMDQVREGALDGLSAGFRVIRSRRDAKGVVNVLEAALHEVSLTPMGAYDGARVLATREPGQVGLTSAGPTLPPMPDVNLTPVGPLRNLWP